MIILECRFVFKLILIYIILMENCRKSRQRVDTERLSKQIAEYFLNNCNGSYRGIMLCKAEECVLYDLQNFLQYPLNAFDYPVFVGEPDSKYFNVDVFETIKRKEVVSI